MTEYTEGFLQFVRWYEAFHCWGSIRRQCWLTAKPMSEPRQRSIMISVPVQSSKKIGIAACSSLNPVEQFGGNPSPGANTNDNRKRADHPTWPTCNREFSAISKDRHYVLGNHCVDTLTKDEFLGVGHTADRDSVQTPARTVTKTIAKETPASNHC